MWALLEIARAIADERVSSPEHHYRTFCIKRVCHRRQTARDAGSGGERRYTHLASQSRQCIGGMHRGLLVTKIDDRQFRPARPIVERRDVPAGESENVSNAKLFNLANYQVAAMQPRQPVSATYRRRHGVGDRQIVAARRPSGLQRHPGTALEMHGNEDRAAGWLVDLDYEVIALSEPGPDSDVRFNLVDPVWVGKNFDGACWVRVRVTLSTLI